MAILPLKLQFRAEMSGNFPAVGAASVADCKKLPLKLQFRAEMSGNFLSWEGRLQWQIARNYH